MLRLLTAMPFHTGHMSRRGADEISGAKQLQARYARPAEATMGAAERDRWIVHLHAHGWNATKIGHHVELSRRGVEMAMQRIAEGRPGRVRE